MYPRLQFRPAAASLLLGAASAWASPTSPVSDPALAPEVVLIGLTESAFLGVNRNDMEAALMILGQNTARSMGHPLKLEVRSYPDAASFGAAVRRGEVRLAIADSWTYLGMVLAQLDTPRYVSMTGPSAGKRYLLVTRRDSGLRSLADLHGRDLLLCEIVNSSLGDPWLSTLLLSERLDPAGHQILTLFKTDRLVPLQEKDLEPVRRLRRQYDELTRRASAAAPVQAASNTSP